jgi:hypothetical protein
MVTTNILNNGKEDEFLPRNNVNLFDQIKLCIISDYFPKTLSKLPKGTMEFFIRDGDLAINYHETELSLRGPAEAPKIGGMTRSRLLTFLMLIEDKITSHPPLDYGNIIIKYELLEDGEVDGTIIIKTQVNHRRR